MIKIRILISSLLFFSVFLLLDIKIYAADSFEEIIIESVTLSSTDLRTRPTITIEGQNLPDLRLWKATNNPSGGYMYHNLKLDTTPVSVPYGNCDGCWGIHKISSTPTELIIRLTVNTTSPFYNMLPQVINVQIELSDYYSSVHSGTPNQKLLIDFNKFGPSTDFEIEKTYKSIIAPTGLVLQSDIDSIVANWDVVTISDLAGYNIYLDGVKINEGLLNSPSYIISDLKPATNYRVAVTAVNTYGIESNFSDEVSISTLLLPFDLNPLRITHDSAVISWSNFKASYNVYLNDELIASDITTNRYTLSNLTYDKDYEIKVTYLDTYGRLVESNVFMLHTLDLPTLQVPQIKVSNVTHNSASVEWTNVAKSYELYINDVLHSEYSRNYDYLRNLDSETTFNLKLIAIDEFNRVVESDVISFTTLVKPVVTARPPTPIPIPPPKVSDTGNEELDLANDHLVEGANEVKRQSFSIIWIIIGVLILVFGSLWLMKLFKKKVSKVTVSSSKNSSSSSSSINTNKSYKPSNALSNATKKTYRRSNKSNNSYYQRRRYYVKKRTR